MGFISPSVRHFTDKIDPLSRPASAVAFSVFGKKTPPPTPGVPNPNDAANAAQAQTDQMRMRRGMLSNIYAGAMNQQPVSGKTMLGS